MTYEKNTQNLPIFAGVVEVRAKLFLLLAALGCMLAAPSLHASETAAPVWQLSVRPSICVSYNSDEPCTMAMNVRWKGNAEADVCLRDAIDEPLLHCWENARSGSIDVSYSNTGDVLYQLVAQDTGRVLAEAEIKVINRDLRSSRKRRRHVWSIL